MQNKKGLATNRGFVAITILIACLVLSLGMLPAPALADDTTSVGASVTVASTGSYGARVIDSFRVVFAWEALGKPNHFGAWIFEQGWVSIKLESKVKNCKQVSIWAENIGGKTSRFEVYTSTDGKRWTPIGSGNCTSHTYAEYSFNGTYGDVGYVKVKLDKTTPKRWSTLMGLDAVRAKGGDS